MDGKCPVHSTMPQWMSEKNYFFKLSAYGAASGAFPANPGFIIPNRGRTRSCVCTAGSRTSRSPARHPWGIPLPYDPSNTVYVWFDALINYITAVGYGTDRNGSRYWGRPTCT